MSALEETERHLPGSTTAFLFAVFGLIAVFMGHLVSLAVVLSTLALILAAYGRFKVRRSAVPYSKASLARSLWAFRLGVLGLLLGVVVWVLWRTGVLPFISK